MLKTLPYTSACNTAAICFPTYHQIVSTQKIDFFRKIGQGKRRKKESVA